MLNGLITSLPRNGASEKTVFAVSFCCYALFAGQVGRAFVLHTYPFSSEVKSIA
ncbi:hypothetical protein BN3661_02292 [Eubacteriaceae bacterium CHKCI005]|uniref:Uncharacterized protein n=1 Tax=Solibaculum mannosilyticum TaxID=2780922 RepID=A0A7I8D035_9FIRM|nr:hypothetical protein C12CBH8_07690 [Solibaculum mannosilyticum]CZT58036.1 hypothetical protein BN3661_02292 [Eubacteriaceae bacterium CHKCI005]